MKRSENDERLQSLLNQFNYAVQDVHAAEEPGSIEKPGDSEPHRFQDLEPAVESDGRLDPPVRASIEPPRKDTSPNEIPGTTEDPAPTSTSVNELRQIPIDAIRIGSINAREISDDDADLGELAESIRQRGLLQPVLVWAVTEGFLLIAGERRVRAARLAGLTEIPAVVKTGFESMDGESDAVIDMVTENVQRKNFEPWEESAAYERLMAQGMSVRQIAHLIGKAPGYVSVLMKLTRHPSIRAALESRAISTWSLATEMNRLVAADGHEKWSGAVDEALAFIRSRRPTVPEFRGWIVEQTKEHIPGHIRSKAPARRSGSSFLQREELRWTKMRSDELPRLSRKEILWYREFLKKKLDEVEQVLAAESSD